MKDVKLNSNLWLTGEGNIAENTRTRLKEKVGLNYFIIMNKFNLVFILFFIGLVSSCENDLVDIEEKVSGNIDLESLPNSIQPYFTEFSSFLENSSSISELKSKTDSLLTVIELDNSISTFEKDFIQTLAIVNKHSAELWSPTSFGGLGYFDIYCGTPTWRLNLGNVISADVSGAGGFFLRLGVLTALGAVPGTNGAILGGAAISAAYASGMYSLTQL